MIVFVAHTAIDTCNGSNKGESDAVDCGTTQIAIEQFTKREKWKMFLKIASVKALE